MTETAKTAETTYRIEFDRIGRTHDVAPLTVTVAETPIVSDVLAERVWRYARPHLASRDVEVAVELGTEPGTGGKGVIYVGFRNGGTFTVTPVPATAGTETATTAAAEER